MFIDFTIIIYFSVKQNTFSGITGNVKVDGNGDRDPDYSLWTYQESTGQFEVSMEAQMTSSDADVCIVGNET